MLTRLRDTLSGTKPERDVEDCLECRVIGTVTCFGVAAYTFSQRVPANRVWLTCFSGVGRRGRACSTRVEVENVSLTRVEVVSLRRDGRRLL